MENFVVSARKYRPATFDTVVGQKSITNTLKNAIKTKHLAQAFLFCGPRGVGKTTCARILAKTINCFNRTETIEACDECDSCKSFNEGASLNIFELDAASNNSVDDIRNLVDQVRVAPQLGTHKVYIIDEVHMLSNAAFNAFLKTLEEPPAHAIFILATTEKHKIIPTILSRCQIFDFNRIGITDISEHLKLIAEKENIDAEEAALHVVAEKADGALRDALSIFDQLVSFAGNKLTYEAVIENLNILDYDYYFKASDYLIQGNISKSLLLFNEILNKGFNGHLFINGLASHFRNLLVCKDKSTVELLEVGKSVQENYLKQAATSPLEFLLPALEICRQCDIQYKSSKNQRLLVELSLMQLASILTDQTDSVEKKKPKIKAPDYQSGDETNLIKVEEPKSANKETVKTVEPEAITEPQKSLSDIPESKKPAPIKKAGKLSSLGLKSKTSSLSINELTAEKQVEATHESIEYTSNSRNVFTTDELLKVWNTLAEKIKKDQLEGSSMVYAAMTTHTPKLEKDFQILLKVDNKSQEEEVKHFRTDIHSFLRKALKNGAVELITSIQKDKKQKKAYTPEEKFNKLAEENPKLLRLKKELDLDFF